MRFTFEVLASLRLTDMTTLRLSYRSLITMNPCGEVSLKLDTLPGGLNIALLEINFTVKTAIKLSGRKDGVSRGAKRR